MRITLQDNQYAIRLWTQEFGEVFVMKEDSFAPLLFSTIRAAKDYIAAHTETEAMFRHQIQEVWRQGTFLMESPLEIFTGYVETLPSLIKQNAYAGCLVALSEQAKRSKETMSMLSLQEEFSLLVGDPARTDASVWSTKWGNEAHIPLRQLFIQQVGIEFEKYAY